MSTIKPDALTPQRLREIADRLSACASRWNSREQLEFMEDRKMVEDLRREADRLEGGNRCLD